MYGKFCFTRSHDIDTDTILLHKGLVSDTVGLLPGTANHVPACKFVHARNKKRKKNVTAKNKIAVKKIFFGG